MDLLTHAALGAACAHLALGRQHKKIAWKVGALSAMSPDLDLLIHYFSHNPLSIEYWHRNFTHALAFIPLAALLVTLILMIIPSFRKNWQITFMASLIGVSTHGLLDACTSYGTLLLWPWSTHRISWDVIAIIDPLFTIILVLGVAWSVIFNERTMVSISLVLAGLFLLFNNYQHQRAIMALNKYAEKNNMHVTAIRAIPFLGSSTHWRIIAQERHCFFIANAKTPLMSKSQLQPVTNTLRFSEQNIPFSLTQGQQRDIAIFSWFTDDFLIVANTKPFLLADGRYTAGDRSPIQSLWGIEITPKASQVKRIRPIQINELCPSP